MLQEMFVGQLDKLIPSEFTTQASLKDFGNYLHGGIKTFLKTPRSVKSLTNVLRVLFPAVSGEVYWPDFVAITALQVFAPDVYGVIRDNRDQFAWYASNVLGHDDDRETRKKFEDAWLERVGPENKSAVSELVNRLFPNTGSGYGRGSYGSDWSARWHAELRICSPECFERYFQFRVPSGEFSEAEWKEVLSQLDQPAAVDDKIRAVCAQHGANRRTSRAKEFFGEGITFRNTWGTARAGDCLA
jgi:predicted KAP-like P-loop ATPase